MLERPAECDTCPLHAHNIANGFMRAEGSGAIPLMVVAEALGGHEADDGLPLRPQAPAGGMFDRTWRRAGLTREAVVLTNTLHCQPGKANLLEHQWYEFDAIQHCKVHMDREVERFRPKVMLALGGVALRTLTGYCGQKRSITNVRGYTLDNVRYPGIPVVPTYHPSYLVRDKSNLIGVFKFDSIRAERLAKAHGQFRRPTKRYMKFPSIWEAEEWLRWLKLHPELLIVRDIETDDSITGEDESALRVNTLGQVEYNPLKPEYEDAPDEEKEKEEAVQSEYKYISNNTRITQVQFSVVGDGDAMVLPWDGGQFSRLAMEVMALPNPKAGWNNWQFDDPIAAMAGERLAGENHDLMWAYHHLQPDLPRGLQYAMSFYFPEAEPWKDKAATDLGEYGGDDVSYLRAAGPKILQALKERGIWTGYERHVLRMHPILVRASARGMPVDDERRVALGERVDELRAGVDRELQGMFPDELRNCKPEEGYVNPKIAEKKKQQPNEGLEEGERWVQRLFTAKAGRSALPIVDETTGVHTDGDELSENIDSDGVSSYGDTGSIEEGSEGGTADDRPSDAVGGSVLRWCRLQPFLPNSAPQILRYIRWKREREVEEKIAGYRRNSRFSGYSDLALREMAERNAIYVVPKKFREDKDTTEKKELERLGAKTGDKFFPMVVEHREYRKVKSTYVEGWKPKGDGRVHPVFGFGPAAGQLASTGPASMTMPKPGGRETLAEARKTDLAIMCRSMVVAPPGYKLVFFDKKSFHAMTLGFNAQDPLYLRLAKMDIHSFVTANFMWMNERAEFLNYGLPSNPEKWVDLTDEELALLLAMVKKRWKAIRDKKAKCTILGIGLGLQAAKCFEMNKRDEVNPRGFESKAEVVKFQQVLKGLFPKIFRFHAAIRDLAHRQQFLKTRFGYMRWFFDVKHHVFKAGRWEEVAGRDAEAVIALPVQNDAHGMIKEEVIKLDELGMLDKFGWMNIVHDELQFCCPDHYVEECLYEVPRVMNRPCGVLTDSIVAPGGLVVEVDASVGASWDKMEGVK